MEIRSATTQDIPAIVTLLKESLGESLMPKSENYWRWKHIENPFGTSPVLLCEEGGHLIGVRAFMRWRWQHGDLKFSAVRAVDTATHPQHQGKGIFKKLTLALVDQCKKEGDHFVFNTPNEQSKPGYLKMGWSVAGKLPVSVGVNNIFGMTLHAAGKKTDDDIAVQTGNDLSAFLNHHGLENLIAHTNQQLQGIHTDYSRAYLQWRYQKVPVASYVAFGETKGNELTALVIGRVKNTRIGRELRITDGFITESGSHLREQLRDFVTASRIDYTTLAATAFVPGISKVLPGVGFKLKLPIGPIVTVRPLQMGDLTQFHNFAGWLPALGDLELF